MHVHMKPTSNKTTNPQPRCLHLWPANINNRRSWITIGYAGFAFAARSRLCDLAEVHGRKGICKKALRVHQFAEISVALPGDRQKLNVGEAPAFDKALQRL